MVDKLLLVIVTVNFILTLYGFIKSLPKKEEEEEIIQHEKQTEVSGMYDVQAYIDRMAKMKVEYYDGVPLYDSPPPKVKTDFTGVEVITPSMEMEIDKRIK